MAEMKTLTLNDVKYEVVDANGVRAVPQELTDEQKAQVRANIGLIKNGVTNLFDIDNLLITGSDAGNIGRPPLVEGSVIRLSGRAGHYAGSIITMPVQENSELTFSAYFYGETGRVEFSCFKSLTDKNIIVESVRVKTVDLTTAGVVSFTVSIPSGYHYFGFCGYSANQYGIYVENIILTDGIINKGIIDESLSMSGYVADAAAVGKALSCVTEDVEKYLSGSENILSGVLWEDGYIYESGGEDDANLVYDGIPRRMVDGLPIESGKKYVFYLNIPTYKSSEYANHTINLNISEYDVNGSFIQRVANDVLSGETIGDIEYIEYEYEAPSNVHFIRVHFRTWGYDVSTLISAYEYGTGKAQRLLPVITENDDGKLLIAKRGLWKATQLDLGAFATIEDTIVAEKCMEFSSLNLTAGNSDSFVYFTDPHSVTEEEMRGQLSLVEKYYNATNSQMIVCGGDWLRNSETQQEACYKLAYYYAWMRRISRDKCIYVGANHDTNEYGVDASGNAYSGKMPYDTVRNLMGRGEDTVYYAYKNGKTQYYALDTASESDSGITNYHLEQIAWLAAQLKENDAENSAIIHHALYHNYNDTYKVTKFTETVTQLCNAYNTSSSVTISGTTYDFSDCTGCVRFVLGGHIHQDIVEVYNNIPVISSIDMKANQNTNFDLCLADYENNVLHMIRIGSGSNRTISLATR